MSDITPITNLIGDLDTYADELDGEGSHNAANGCRAAIETIEAQDTQIEWLRAEIERLTAALLSADCPGGGWTGISPDTEPTVENCMAADACGCTLGAALARGEEKL